MTIKILEELESMGNARNPKIALLKKYSENKRVKKVMRLTYDWSITFGITTKPVKENPSKIEDFEIPNWDDFKILCKQLSNREITGNAARDAFKELLRKSTIGERKWYTRILNRDLKIGLSVKTINAAWPGFLKTFGVMLAHTLKDDMKLKFPVAVEPKLDGMRVLVVISEETKKAFSRDGLELPTLKFLVEECASVCGQNEIVFDGEIYSENWNETMHLVKKESLPKEERDKLTYRLFDIVYADNFANGIDPRPYKERRKAIDKFDYSKTHIKPVETFIAQSMNDINEQYSKCLDEGYEGVMIKSLDGEYKEGRSKVWLKFKPEETFDGRIVGFFEGKEDTKHEGKLGGFIVKMENGETLRVGGGLTDLQREEFWSKKDELKDKILEFKAQGNDTVTKSARFGRFVRLRVDRA